MLQTDTSLLRGWLDARDADAFSALVERYSGMVFATARRILRDAGQAEDVAQECFLKLGQLEEPRGTSLGALLHTMATREALKRLDAETRRRRREETYSRQAGAAQEPEWDDVAPYVDEAIAGLPSSLHAPLVARYLEGKSYVDIAKSLSVDESTIRYRTKKAIDEVRKSLRRKGIVLGAAAAANLLKMNAIQAAPAALTSNLGAAAIAGVSGSVTSTLTSAALIGGSLMWKKVAILAALAIVVAGSWTASTLLSRDRSQEDNAMSDSDASTSDSVPSDSLIAEESLDARDPSTESTESPDLQASNLDGAESATQASLTGLPKTLAEFMARVGETPEEISHRSFTSADIPKDNGAHYFMLAFELMDEEDVERFLELWQASESFLGLALDPEMLAMIEKYQPLLDLIRQGLEVGNAMLPEAIHGPYEELPYLSPWRNLVRMLAFEAQLFESQGDYHAAIANYLAALEFDTESARGGTLIGALVGYAGNRTVIDGLNNLIDSGELYPIHYSQLIDELADIDVESLTAFELQVSEGDGLDDWMIRQLQQGLTFQELINDIGDGIPDLQGLSEEALQSYFDEFLGHREQIIEMSALPFYEAQAFDIDALVADNPLSRALLPSVFRVMISSTGNQTSIRGTSTMAALEWFHVEHGAYPAALESLVPGYLPGAPIDPFTGNPFIYSTYQGDYTLYSTGADMQDNSGLPGRARDIGTDLVIHQAADEE